MIQTALKPRASWLRPSDTAVHMYVSSTLNQMSHCAHLWQISSGVGGVRGGVHTEEEMGNVLEHPNKNPQEEITRSSVCLGTAGFISIEGNTLTSSKVFV